MTFIDINALKKSDINQISISDINQSIYVRTALASHAKKSKLTKTKTYLAIGLYVYFSIRNIMKNIIKQYITQVVARAPIIHVI